jgi:hypothetical protein
LRTFFDKLNRKQISDFGMLIAADTAAATGQSRGQCVSPGCQHFIILRSRVETATAHHGGQAVRLARIFQ